MVLLRTFSAACPGAVAAALGVVPFSASSFLESCVFSCSCSDESKSESIAVFFSCSSFPVSIILPLGCPGGNFFFLGGGSVDPEGQDSGLGSVTGLGGVGWLDPDVVGHGTCIAELG